MALFDVFGSKDPLTGMTKRVANSHSYGGSEEPEVPGCMDDPVDYVDSCHGVGGPKAKSNQEEQDGSLVVGLDVAEECGIMVRLVFAVVD